jgi:hypothetical protein
MAKGKSGGPSFEGTLDDSQNALLAKAMSEGTLASEVAALPDNAPSDGLVIGGPVVAGPTLDIERDAAAQQGIAMAQMQAAAANPDATPLLKVQAKNMEAALRMAEPISPPTVARVNQVAVQIPSDVRDVPNGLTTKNPQQAITLWTLFTEPITNELADLAASYGFASKPLVWLGQKLYELVVLRDWAPPRGFCPEAFNASEVEQHQPLYRALMTTFGLSTGRPLLRAAERADAPLMAYMQACYDELIREKAKAVNDTRKHQTVDNWKVEAKAGASA